MSFLRKLLHHNTSPKNSAQLAKERLQIIVSHERAENSGPEYLPALRQDLIKVIAKYVSVAPDQVKVDLEQIGNKAILELNITLDEPVTEAN